jgi:hypothetical protein
MESAARFETQVLDKHTPAGVKALEGISLTTRAVQREYQPAAQTLAKRML